MQATPPPSIAMPAPSLPTIDMQLTGTANLTKPSQVKMGSIFMHVFLKMTKEYVAYQYVDGPEYHLDVVIHPYVEESASGKVRLPVDFKWAERQLARVVYRCARESIINECAERLFRTIKKIAPYSITSAPPAELMID